VGLLENVQQLESEKAALESAKAGLQSRLAAGESFVQESTLAAGDALDGFAELAVLVQQLWAEKQDLERQVTVAKKVPCPHIPLFPDVRVCLAAAGVQRHVRGYMSRI
jgi:hypothetical protein